MVTDIEDLFCHQNFKILKSPVYRNNENLKSATGDLYCRNCFEKTQEKCFACDQLIVGKVIKSNGKVSPWKVFIENQWKSGDNDFCKIVMLMIRCSWRLLNIGAQRLCTKVDVCHQNGQNCHRHLKVVTYIFGYLNIRYQHECNQNVIEFFWRLLATSLLVTDLGVGLC